jgi:hypothetical protein
MNNELVIDRFGIKQNNNSDERITQIKKISNDSLFYFAIFLGAFFLLKLIPYMYGVVSELDLGINEVVVSLLGFGNVFFMFLINKVFHKKTYDD